MAPICLVVLTGVLAAGCSGTTAQSSSAEGPDAAEVQKLVESALDSQYRLSHAGEQRRLSLDGEVHTPKQNEPLRAGPCDLMEPADGSAYISSDHMRLGPPAELPAVYEVRLSQYRSGFGVSVYLLSTDADSDKILAEVHTAAQQCSERIVAMPAQSRTRGRATVITTAQATRFGTVFGLAVLTDDERPKPTSPSPLWSIGPDGKLTPLGPLTTDPPAVTDSVPYGQAQLFASQGRFLVKVVRVADRPRGGLGADGMARLSGDARTDAEKALALALKALPAG